MTAAAQRPQIAVAGNPDTATLIAVSALAYVLAVALHEHVGHGMACLAMGSYPKELGAFYVDCDSDRLSSLGMRIVALAGPAMSLLTGVAAFLVLRRIPPASSLPYYFTWLLGGVGLMSAAGYPLFSGVSGLGDLGTTRDGAFFGATPEIFWRIALTVAGVVAYTMVARYLCRTIAPCVGAVAGGQMAIARRATMISYFTGAVVYLAIGAFNPMGWTIIVMSVLPSSMGGTSGLLWMWPIYRRRAATQADGQGLYFSRNWTWIGVSALVVLAYAIMFGPTWRP
jgi:hypothetical protein